jgi:dTDP-glucose pyrophosphorylase
MIVIPMAGESSRFKKAGYTLPKFMLPLDGRPLFDWTLLSFQSYFDDENFVFIARDTPEIRTFLDERILFLGIKKVNCIFIEESTRGQAETVFIGVSRLKQIEINFKSEPLTIFNIDTIRPNFTYPEWHGINGWVEVFEAPGDNWSFVQPESDNSPLIKKCVEKIRISDLCCTGLYSFTNFDQYLAAYEFELKHPSSFELFIAPIYNHLISKSEEIYYYQTLSYNVILSGTPDEYEKLISSKIGSYFTNL